jgi:hypothetical protein
MAGEAGLPHLPPPAGVVVGVVWKYQLTQGSEAALIKWRWRWRGRQASPTCPLPQERGLGAGGGGSSLL